MKVSIGREIDKDRLRGLQAAEEEHQTKLRRRCEKQRKAVLDRKEQETKRQKGTQTVPWLRRRSKSGERGRLSTKERRRGRIW